jgi:hypothetical protein
LPAHRAFSITQAIRAVNNLENQSCAVAGKPLSPLARREADSDFPY